MRTLLVLGAGGHGKAVAEAALLSGDWQQISFIDDRWPQLDTAFGIAVVGNIDSLPNHAESVAGAIAAIGSNIKRKDWQETIRSAQIPLVSVVHPRAWVSPSAVIGPGSAVMPLAVVGTEARLGQGVIVNAGAVVDHDAILEDFAHIGVGASLAGGVKICHGAWLQAGCSAGDGVVVEPGQVIEPGSALMTKD